MKKTTVILIVIVIVSVALRVAVALYLGNVVDAPPLLTDQRSYHALGERLISGYGFSFDRGWYPFTAANTPTAHWSFLYSLFVASVYGVFGVNPLSVRIIQAILGGILLPLLAYLFSRRLFESAVFKQHNVNAVQIGLMAAGISALYLYFILYSATLMTETFYIITLLWSLYLAMGLAQRPTLKNGLLLGVSLGLATLLRQSILPWIVVLVVWLVWVAVRSRSSHRMIAALALAGLLIGLVIAPFTIRNYRVYGEFLLLNSNAGYAMYSAQHPMHGTDFQEFVGVPIPDDVNGMNEAQMDRDLMRRGIGFVLADPGRYVLLSLSRVVDFFEFWPTSDTTLLNNLGRVGSFGLMLPFMIYGLALAFIWGGPKAQGGWIEFTITPLAMILLFIGLYTIQHVLTWAMPRYRLPADAVLLSFAALGLSQLARWLTSKFRNQRHQAVARQRLEDYNQVNN
jgi:4-amino-4-deoxy-L-arabinose transferase-like glycosyltransferase